MDREKRKLLILPFAGKVADEVSASDKAVTLANELIECGRIGEDSAVGGFRINVEHSAERRDSRNRIQSGQADAQGLPAAH